MKRFASRLAFVVNVAAGIQGAFAMMNMGHYHWRHSADHRQSGRQLSYEVYSAGAASSSRDSGVDDVVAFHQSDVVLEDKSAAHAAAGAWASSVPAVEAKTPEALAPRLPAPGPEEPQRVEQTPPVEVKATGLVVNRSSSFVVPGLAHESDFAASLRQSLESIAHESDFAESYPTPWPNAGFRSPHAFPLLHVVSLGHQRKVAKSSDDEPLFGPPLMFASNAFALMPSIGLLSCVVPLLSIGLCLCKFGMRDRFDTLKKPSQKQVKVVNLTPIPHILTQPPSYTMKKHTLRRVHGAVAEHSSMEELGKLMSMWDGTVATFSSIVGTGVLALPYAFSVAGIVGGTVMMLIFVACSAYTAHLMTWTMNSTVSEARCGGLRPELQGWPFLVEVAFGRMAKWAIVVFLVVELWGYLLSCMITAAMNMSQIFSSLSPLSATVLLVIIAYLLTSLPNRYLTRLNIAANVCFVACLLMFLVTGMLLPEKAPAAEIDIAVRPQGLLPAAGILVFSPAAHSFYPSVMQRMQEPQKFPVCLRRAYCMASVVYLGIGILGYWFFGHAVQPSLVRNVGLDLHMVSVPGLGWMNLMAAVGIVIKMLAMQPLILMPLISTIEDVLGESRGVHLTKNNASGQLVTVGVLAVSTVASLQFADEISMVLSFIGSVFCMTIAFAVPVLCHWRLAEEPIGTMKRIGFTCLLLGAGFVSMNAIAEAI